MKKYRFYFTVNDNQEWFIDRVETWDGMQYIEDEDMNIKWKNKKISL